MPYSVFEYFGSGSNYWGVTIFDIDDYKNTTKNKTTRAYGGVEFNAAGGILIFGSNTWNSTAAITSITVTGFLTGMAVGSTFALYGVK
jgi:hypothetical protein